MKESLRGDECDSDEGVMKNLKEYFQEYEKEFHMEEFLSKIYNYGTLVPISWLKSNSLPLELIPQPKQLRVENCERFFTLNNL